MCIRSIDLMHLVTFYYIYSFLLQGSVGSVEKTFKGNKHHSHTRERTGRDQLTELSILI